VTDSHTKDKHFEIFAYEVRTKRLEYSIDAQFLEKINSEYEVVIYNQHP